MAMPLLVIMLGFQAATALVGMVMLTTIAVLLSTEWRGLDVRSAWQLLLSSAVGIPVWVLVVRLAPETILKGALGILLVSFSLYSHLPRSAASPASEVGVQLRICCGSAWGRLQRQRAAGGSIRCYATLGA